VRNATQGVPYRGLVNGSLLGGGTLLRRMT